MKEELRLLREEMRKEGIDVYLLPMDDFHQSEYVAPYFRTIRFVSGFSGSSANLVVTEDEACLFTDGRYFVQAEKQLSGSGVKLMRMGEPDVPALDDYIGETLEALYRARIEDLQAGEEDENGGMVFPETDYAKDSRTAVGVLGFDGRCVDYRHGEKLGTIAETLLCEVRSDLDLVGRIWKDRPALPSAPVWILEEKWAGMSAAEKLRAVREEMAAEGADTHLICSLDDIAWLLNLRGNDVPCNPVFLSYLMMNHEKAWLFADPGAFSEEAVEYLASLQVELLPYDRFYDAVSLIGEDVVLVESGKTNYRTIASLPEDVSIIDAMLPTSRMKAVKNAVEIENMRRAHIKDGVAMTRFSFFVKHAFDAEGRLTEDAREKLLLGIRAAVREGADSTAMPELLPFLKDAAGAPEVTEDRIDPEKLRFTELTGALYLETLRKAQDGYIEPSFHTISAYAENAALPHYSASLASDREVLPRGMYLVDSGGQYYEGTTDITRTYVMGPLSAEERKHFTMVLQAMLRLGDVQFLHGSTGITLDYTARELFWKEGLNYNHGTGHGVGYLLNCHERPNGIRYRMVPERMDSGVFEPGYITSDEPGIYIEGSHGIRTENLTLCEKALENEYGTFLRFRFLTLCPIDRDGIDPTIMTAHDLELLNAYHREVYGQLAPYFEGEELAWLKEATAPLSV